MQTAFSVVPDSSVHARSGPLTTHSDPNHMQSASPRRRKSVTTDGLPEQQRNEQQRWSPPAIPNNSYGPSVSSPEKRQRSNSSALRSGIPVPQFSPKARAAVNQSPRASPPRKNLSYRPDTRSRPVTPSQSAQEAYNPALTALPPLHITPALTDPNDTESPSTGHTIATPPAPASFSRTDYFGHAKETSPRAGKGKYDLAHISSMQTGTDDHHARSYDSGDLYNRPLASRPIVSPPAAATERVRAQTPHSNEARATMENVAPAEARTRRRGRTESDKKAMLAKALQRANTAVLLDNAQNYEGALESYNDACNLLQMVMERTSAEDDRRKLDAIKLTYSNRIEELEQLVETTRPGTAGEEKNLPPRPPNDESVAPSPVNAPYGGGSYFGTSAAVTSLRETPAAAARPADPETSMSSSGLHRATDAPRLPSYVAGGGAGGPDRDSFFSGTMAAVENSARAQANATWDAQQQQQQQYNAQPLQQSYQSPSLSQQPHHDAYTHHAQAYAGSALHAQPDLRSEHPSAAAAGIEPQPLSLNKNTLLPLPEQSKFLPMPLSPKRPPPVTPPEDEHVDGAWHHQQQQQQHGAPLEHTRSHVESRDSADWLDTINETASSGGDDDDNDDDDADSVHSVSSQRGMRRKHIRGTSGNTDPDFDAAFDAAVEAAYNEGFEPDLEARRKRLTGLEGSGSSGGGMLSSQLPPAVAGDPGLHVAEVSPADSAQDLDDDEDDDAELNDEEEEAILEALTQDDGSGQGGFNFGLQSKSSSSTQPRQSDSSGYSSRSTWQSSQTSDRATAATSLSTVAEDEFASRYGGAVSADGNGGVPPPPRISLPRTPGVTNSSRVSSVRNRRLSGQNAKQLKIETSTVRPEQRQRASTFHHPGSPFLEDEEAQAMPEPSAAAARPIGDGLHPPLSSDPGHDHLLASPPSLDLRSASSDNSKSLLTPAIEYRHVYDEQSGDFHAERPILIRKNQSATSLREHTGHTLLVASPDVETHPSIITPMSSTFGPYATAKRPQNPMTSQRAQLTSFGPSFEGQQHNGGIYLFDTTLAASRTPLSPRSPNLATVPTALEPCPEAFLLRPFWLMRNLGASLTHPRGAFVTTKLFVAREVWQTRGVKLRLLEDKVANCDLLTAALGRLASVDTYDADAVMDELQGFEEVLDRVQTALAKKLGHDVGVHGALASFKDAPTPGGAFGDDGTGSAGAGADPATDKAHKSSSGKSYLSSWRKLRSKSSGAPLTTGATHRTGGAHPKPSAAAAAAERELHTIPSVPMTSFVPVERRGNQFRRDARNAVFEGPQREYMASLARLFDGAQVLGESLFSVVFLFRWWIVHADVSFFLCRSNRPSGRGPGPQALVPDARRP